MSKRLARNRRNRPLHDTSAPLYHENHKRPVTRREFLGQGFLAGGAFVTAPPLLSLLMSKKAHALVTDPTNTDPSIGCGLGGGAGKIPFICVDLGGGANMAGSNVLVGGPNGQEDFLSTAGYNKLGLPGDRIPSVADTLNGLGDHVSRDLGLAFHTDSAFLRGIMSKTSATTRSRVNGAVIPNRSDNDTQNNPHNPMYGIAKYGASGELLDLIGTANSDSGGRSMAPATLIDLSKRPTKVDRPSDATGLVDTGDLGTMMPNPAEAGAVMNAIRNISASRIGIRTDQLDSTPGFTSDGKSLQNLIDCGYHKTADTVTRFGDISAFDPLSDNHIVNDAATTQPPTFTNQNRLADIPGLPDNPDPTLNTTPIFTSAELSNGRFSSTASVMKLVNNGLAGAGTIALGGYDYHNGTRSTGELRDFEAGQVIGATLEYAARVGSPVMVYVFTDGSLASNGRIDSSANGRGKGEWTGDNSSTSASFFLVYNPTGRPTLVGNTVEDQAKHQQLGFFRSSASVETTATTPGANNVNQLVNMVLLNYLALHGDADVATFTSLFGNGLGTDQASLDKYIAFQAIR